MWYACWCVLTLLYCTTVRSGVQVDDMGYPSRIRIGWAASERCVARRVSEQGEAGQGTSSRHGRGEVRERDTNTGRLYHCTQSAGVTVYGRLYLR